MNTVKNIVVTATLLAIGYGAYCILNSPVSDEYSSLPPPNFLGESDTSQPTDRPGVPEISVDVGQPVPLGTEQPDPSDEAGVAENVAPSDPAVTTSSPVALSPDDTDGGKHHHPQGLASNDLSPADSSQTSLGHHGVHGATDSQSPVAGPGASVTETSQPVDTHEQHQHGSVPSTSGSAYPNAIAPTGQPTYESPQSSVSFYAKSGPSQDNSTSTYEPGSAGSDAPVPSTDPPADQQGFEAAWQAVQSELNAGRLADALFALSLWYHDPSLNNEQHERCLQLLDQLAGTVIYSQHSFLEPAYVVQAGDTWASLAKQLQISEVALARVNGIDLESGLTPGSALKILRGPFRAEVSLQRHELTVFLGSYYAGRFPVRIGPELPDREAVYEIVEKSNGHEYFDNRTGRRVPANDPNNAYGALWLGLRGDQVTAAHNVGIHVYTGVDPNLGSIGINSADVADVATILNVGSRVIVRRE